MKKKLILIMAAIVLGSSGVLAASIKFSDVSGGSWYESAVENLAARGIIKGYSDGSFKPDQNVNRAEMVVMLSRLLEYLETGKVTASDWKTYTNDSYAYELEYPSDWKYTEIDDTGVGFMRSSASIGSDAHGSITVFIRDNPENLSAKEYYDGNPGAELFQSAQGGDSEITIGAKTATRFKNVMGLAGGDVVVIPLDKKFMELEATQDLEIFDAMLSTLTFAASESEDGFLIPEAGVSIVFPDDYTVSKNGEENRRGSFVSYDFSSKNDFPAFQEIQFFSEESIQRFTASCEEESPCFFGDYPDSQRYSGQKDAFNKGENYGEYELKTFGERRYFVNSFACNGESCVIREYTTFIEDTKVDIWVTMSDGTQADEADGLFEKFGIIE